MTKSEFVALVENLVEEAGRSGAGLGNSVSLDIAEERVTDAYDEIYGQGQNDVLKLLGEKGAVALKDVR